MRPLVVAVLTTASIQRRRRSWDPTFCCCHVPDQSDTNTNTPNYTIHCHTKRPVRLIALDSPCFTALHFKTWEYLRVTVTQYPWHNGMLYILYCNVVCSMVCPLLAAKNVQLGQLTTESLFPLPSFRERTLIGQLGKFYHGLLLSNMMIF